MFINAYGRPMEELDKLQLRIEARERIGDASYYIASSDGYPIMGFVKHSAPQANLANAVQWKKKEVV